MHHHLPHHLTRLKQRPFPHTQFCCLGGQQYYGLLRLLIRHLAGLHFFSLYQSSRWVWATDLMRPLLFHRLLSQHPALPTPRVLGGCISRFFTASVAFALHEKLGSLFFPFGLTFRRCKIHLMLRAAALLLLLEGLHRFSTTGCPDALDACYLAACPLPGSDFHRQADDDFQDTPCR